MPKAGSSRQNALLIVLSVAVVVGMVVAVLLIYLWRNHVPAVMEGVGLKAAIAVCPAFMLVRVVGGTDDTVLSLIITTGAIVVANAAMYGGLAAFSYWVMTTFGGRRA